MIKKKIINLPKNINISYQFNQFYIEHKEKSEINCRYNLPYFLTYSFAMGMDQNNMMEISIKKSFLKFKASKMMLYTYVSKLINEIKGISELYRGVINIQGLGYSVAITKLNNNKYSLFFRFGFKDKYTYLMPDNIFIENVESAKTKIILWCKNIELLKQVQIQIQNLRRPKAFKLQGIYLNDTYPKIKKFIK